ncbi:MAG: ORF6N domain-containing protein [Candidatus Cloacimonetes bacterium]|nr:ORF6N domain-containing protein [Candidatus Cloacimonadota bacterium]
MNQPLPEITVDNLIIEIRGQKVILDSDLATLYEVETRTLNQAIKRNIDRFPLDFMFQLTNKELTILKSQFVISRWGGRRKLPYVFTEHGAIMAASVLNSPKAVEMSVYVVRAFVKLRTLALQYKELTDKLSKIEERLGEHDTAIMEIVNAIRQLMEPPKPKKKEIGFKLEPNN